MEKFRFYIDSEVEIWSRNHIEIQADNEDEAIKILKASMIDIKESNGVELDNVETEYLYETENFITPDKNGSATLEVYNNDGVMIGDNYNNLFI